VFVFHVSQRPQKGDIIRVGVEIGGFGIHLCRILLRSLCHPQNIIRIEPLVSGCLHYALLAACLFDKSGRDPPWKRAAFFAMIEKASPFGNSSPLLAEITPAPVMGRTVVSLT
jgi:hypothetical protein